MNTKTLATTIVFAAVTVALNPAISGMAVPAPYAPFLFYQIWEIPIVVAFLLIGLKYGATISILNTAVLLVLFPGASPTGPFYNLVAGLSMLLGIYLAYKLVASKQKTDNFTFRYGTKAIAFSAVLGIVLRVGIMSIMTYALLRYPPPVGYAMSEATVIYWVPFIAFFNVTLALYTIPLGYLIAKVISSTLKLHNQS